MSLYVVYITFKVWQVWDRKHGDSREKQADEHDMLKYMTLSNKP